MTETMICPGCGRGIFVDTNEMADDTIYEAEGRGEVHTAGRCQGVRCREEEGTTGHGFSARVQEGTRHDRVTIWEGGGCTGELTVNAGSGNLIADRVTRFMCPRCEDYKAQRNGADRRTRWAQDEADFVWVWGQEAVASLLADAGDSFMAGFNHAARSWMRVSKVTELLLGDACRERDKALAELDRIRDVTPCCPHCGRDYVEGGE